MVSTSVCEQCFPPFIWTHLPAEAAADAAAVDRPASSASGVSNGGGALGGGAGGAGGSGGVGGACVPAFKSACITALREYFDSSDVREVAAR